MTEVASGGSEPATGAFAVPLRPAGRVAVVAEGVSKKFRLYHERNQSLKAAFVRRRRAEYEEFYALRDVSLEVPEGSTVGFIGENGSGKSTLLKCIAHILRPDEGRIEVSGKVSALLELGAGFHPELSGRENVYLNGAILGLSQRELRSRFDDIVQFAGLDRFIDTPVKNYSSGMYVRLGFSVAINVDPDVLLVDEVLAVGDEAFQHRCAEKFAELRAAGKTIVIVSHALGSLRGFCDQVVWLNGGRIERIGASGDVIDAYLGESLEGRHEADDLGARWGSGELQVDRIELVDRAGRPTTKVHTGDRVTIRLMFRAHERIERPVFGIAVHRLDGVEVTAPNSREAGVVPDSVEGTGHVDVEVDRLLLLPGTYDISASAVDYSIVHTFDFRQRAFRFDVLPGDPHESYGGVVSLGGSWSVNGDGPAAGD